eukprot:3021451-Heterocapsa_arctica.AAC.1
MVSLRVIASSGVSTLGKAFSQRLTSHWSCSTLSASQCHPMCILARRLLEALMASVSYPSTT